MSLIHTLCFALACTTILQTTGLPLQGCQHDGKGYAEGSEVTMADPCVRCRCSRGSLVCRLRVCNPLPHPPPAGCLVLTRRSDCCPKLVCNQGPEELNRRRLSDDFVDGGNSLNGCTVNGTVYAEGSAMDSSTRCHYCYCIRGQQHCVKPQCLLAESDCSPTFTSESCCPTKYNCSKRKDDSPTTTVRPISGCQVDGTLYPEGELIPQKGQTCENCYCLKGRLHCEPVVCSVPVNRRCIPVVTAGHCCPTSYNCSGDISLRFKEDQLYNEEEEDMIALNTHNHLHVNSERSIMGSLKTSENKDQLVQTTQPITSDTTSVDEETSTLAETTTTMKEEVTTIEDESTATESTTYETPTTTEGDTTVIPSTTIIPDLSDVEERVNSKRKEDIATTSKLEEVTMQNDVSSNNLTSPMNNTANITGRVEGINKHNTSGPNKSLPSEIEAILNKTELANREEDYDYDYNEPSLPPSLPNLRIIPFVAADAVVDEPVYSSALEKSHSPDDSGPHFYEVPHSSGFSPPAETEGGFVPKEPLLDGPFYESKYDTVYHSSGAALATASLGSLPAITEPPKAAQEVEKCVSGGRSYRHGELLTEPSACDLCVCYYGKILCQEPKCPVPDAGCHLSGNREPGSCCRKVLCSGNNIESPTRVVENVTPPQHLPPFTVADVIVTPDPFRDVIRTEPAPDLPSLIGDIMPYLWDRTSSTTPVSLTTSEPLEAEENNNTNIIVLTQPVTSTTASINKASNVEPISSTTQKIFASTQITPSTSDVLKNKSEVTTKASDEYDYKEVKEEETSEDEFSLDSVFSYLFDSDKWTTQKPKTKVSGKPDSKIQHFKPSSIAGSKSNESIPLVEQSLEHRSDEDVNKLTEIRNSSKVGSTIKTSTHSFQDDEKMQVVTETVKSTLITRKPEIYHTTSENVPMKSTTKLFTKPSTTHSRPVVSKLTPTIPTLSGPDPGAASGLLKLAGCNIYGRMYRVGRIISELSGPCLECMCTEVGVQCRPLKC